MVWELYLNKTLRERETDRHREQRLRTPGGHRGADWES